MKDGDPTITSLLSLMIANPNESKVIKLKKKVCDEDIRHRKGWRFYY